MVKMEMKSKWWNHGLFLYAQKNHIKLITKNNSTIWTKTTTCCVLRIPGKKCFCRVPEIVELLRKIIRSLFTNSKNVKVKDVQLQLKSMLGSKRRQCTWGSLTTRLILPSMMLESSDRMRSGYQHLSLSLVFLLIRASGSKKTALKKMTIGFQALVLIPWNFTTLRSSVQIKLK